MIMSTVQRFVELEQVVRLSSEQARTLLVEGDPQERVWASWTLAARESEAFARELEDVFEREPDPGVRRHFLVVLASLGRRAVVTRTAARDADVDVRATATRCLARLTEPEHASGYDVLLSRAIDIAWQVRQAVADATRHDAPAAVLERLAGLLFDPDPEVRETLRRRFDRGDFPRAPVTEALRVLEGLRARRSSGRDQEQHSELRALVRYRPPLHLV